MHRCLPTTPSCAQTWRISALRKAGFMSTIAKLHDSDSDIFSIDIIACKDEVDEDIFMMIDKNTSKD